MDSLTNSIPFPKTLPPQQAATDPPVTRFCLGQLPSAPKVGFLDSTDTAECQDRRDKLLSGCDDTVHRILVRVQGDCSAWLKRPRGLLSDDDYDLARDDRERTKAPGRVTQE
jgi:hypothetical protein